MSARVPFGNSRLKMPAMIAIHDLKGRNLVFKLLEERLVSEFALRCYCYLLTFNVEGLFWYCGFIWFVGRQ